MSNTIQQHSRQAAEAIKAAAGTISHSVGAQLKLIKESLPAFQKLPATDRHLVVEELRDGLILWASRIDPVRAELRSLIRQLQDEFGETAWQPDPDTPLVEEETMSWTQSFRDRKETES